MLNETEAVQIMKEIALMRKRLMELSRRLEGNDNRPLASTALYVASNKLKLAFNHLIKER
jgi:hypothetical protein